MLKISQNNEWITQRARDFENNEGRFQLRKISMVSDRIGRKLNQFRFQFSVSVCFQLPVIRNPDGKELKYF